MAQSISQESIAVTGLPGTTSGARLVGGTVSGAPVSGTFAVGDLSVDQTGLTWVCVSAGSPGAWTKTIPAILPVSSGGTGVTSSSGTGSNLLSNNSALVAPLEVANIVASAANGTVNIDTLTSSLWLYTSNATANFTLNIRGNNSTTFNSLLSVGQSMTVAFLSANGTTAYYLTGLTVDGNSVTIQWQGGNAPTQGNVSSTDAYTFLILKTAANTYIALATLVQFK